MTRVDILQEIIDEHGFSKYLEVGTNKGGSFLPLKVNFKVAVDPHFKISAKKKLKWILKNPTNLSAKYFEKTSEDFFRNEKKFLDRHQPFDVIFLDGLHTYETTLKDVLYSIEIIRNNGFILIHDCLPPNEASAMETKQFPTEEEQNVPGWTGEWCGDVWKVIVYLKKKYPVMKVAVLDTDYGVGLIDVDSEFAGKKMSIDKALFDEIDSIPFSAFKQDYINLLNLKPSNYFKKSL